MVSSVLCLQDVKVNANFKLGTAVERRQMSLLPVTTDGSPDGRVFIQLDAPMPVGGRIPPFVCNTEEELKKLGVAISSEEDIKEFLRIELELRQQLGLKLATLLKDPDFKETFNRDYKLLSKGKVRDTETGERWDPCLNIKVPSTDGVANSKIEHVDKGVITPTDISQFNWVSLIFEVTHVFYRKNGAWGLVKKLRRIMLKDSAINDLGADVDFLPSRKRPRTK